MFVSTPEIPSCFALCATLWQSHAMEVVLCVRPPYCLTDLRSRPEPSERATPRCPPKSASLCSLRAQLKRVCKPGTSQLCSCDSHLPWLLLRILAKTPIMVSKGSPLKRWLIFFSSSKILNLSDFDEDSLKNVETEAPNSLGFLFFFLFGLKVFS